KTCVDYANVCAFRVTGRFPEPSHFGRITARTNGVFSVTNVDNFAVVYDRGQEFQRHDFHVPVDTCNADVVVAAGADDSSDVSSMTFGVIRVEHDSVVVVKVVAVDVT